mmetsp:Transcript_17945/g.43924  ORF Transcript_17945/g.43924 Transcript_17945/m.43924 type:complete len:741 (+) Transcript_17945:101-2323(+)
MTDLSQRPSSVAGNDSQAKLTDDDLRSSRSSISRTPRRRQSSIITNEQNYAFESSAKLMGVGAFWKHVAKKKPHKRYVTVTPDFKEVRWAAREAGLRLITAKSAKINEFQNVTVGWETPVFKTSLQKGRDNCCFSLIFTNRTLDLQCETQKERDEWAKAFRWLLREKTNGTLTSVGLPFNVKHETHVNTDFEWNNVNLDEEFELGATLGKGAFGLVRVVNHTKSALQMAVKLIDLKTNGEKPEDIKAEVQVLKKCRHPGIVSFFGCAGPDKNRKLWILMELCTGGSLRDLLDMFGPLNEEQIRYVAANVTQALGYLHRKKIIHRDLKAGNILLTSEGLVKLTDFGISLTLGGTQSLQKNQPGQTNTIAGSPLWMPPEIILGAGATYHSDIWSLGITLIELAEGIPPNSNARSALHVMTNITRNPPPQLQEREKWTPEFNGLLEMMLQKTSSNRPDTMKLTLQPFISSVIFEMAASSSGNKKKASPLLEPLRNRLRTKRMEKIWKLKRRKQQADAKAKASNVVNESHLELNSMPPDRMDSSEDDDDDDDVGGFDFEDDDEGFEQGEVVLGFNEPVKDGQGGTVLGMQTLGQVGAEPEAQVQATSFTKWKTKEEASGNSDTGGCQGSGTILSKEGLQDSKTNAQVSPASETDVDVGTIDGMKSLCAPLGDHSGVSSPSNEEINTILDTIIGMLSGCDDKKRQSLLETITEVGALDHIETLQEHDDYDIHAKALKVLKFFEEY